MTVGRDRQLNIMTKYEHVPNCRLAIALIGHARHGKDTAAKMLLKKLPGAERFAFSDYVATVARVREGMTKRDGHTLQKVGMTYRDQNISIWLDCLYWHLVDREPEVVILTGLRFREELSLLTAIAPRHDIIKIVRLDSKGVPFIAQDRDPNYRSESMIDHLPFWHNILVRPNRLDELDSELDNVLRCARIGHALP